VFWLPPSPKKKHRPDRTESVCGRSLAGIVGSKLVSSWCLFVGNVELFVVQFCGPGCSIVQRSYTEWCDGEALNMKWPWLSVGDSAWKKIQEPFFYYFGGVQISEQFTYNLTSGKAVLPRYLRQGGPNFELFFHFSASTNNTINIS